MILLDTHALIWYLTDDPQLPPEIKGQISSAPLIYVSTVVIWEIAMKGSLGKLSLAGRPINSRKAVDEIIEECAAQQFEFLAVSASHAAEAPFLKSVHKDPFDRLLAAQAVQQGLSLVSADAAFDGFSPHLRRLWLDASSRKKKPRKMAP
ncbi:MAG TPA: type II toxin-antitoxin system VapC family toxin [Candidatus Angelobacter sp.]